MTSARSLDRVSFAALGTTVALVLTEPGVANAAERLLRAEITALDLACSRFRTDSEIGRLPAGTATPVSPLLHDALAAALRAARLTDGLVDPTVGQAMLNLGYDRDFATLSSVTESGAAAEPADGTVPVDAAAAADGAAPAGAGVPADVAAPADAGVRADAAASADAAAPATVSTPNSRPAPISALPADSTANSASVPTADSDPASTSASAADSAPVSAADSASVSAADSDPVPAPMATPVVPAPAPGWWRVTLGEDGTVLVPRGVHLDLGATAKAFAADRIAERIAAEIGTGVLVNLGGDIAVRGPVPEGGWRIGIADDHRVAADAPQTSVTITTGGLATSSTTYRSWRQAGRQVHHIVDPRTGDIPPRVWRTVSVAAGSCLDANTASTAAIILGPAAPDWLTERGLPARLVTETGEVRLVAGWPADGDEG